MFWRKKDKNVQAPEDLQEQVIEEQVQDAVEALTELPVIEEVTEQIVEVEIPQVELEPIELPKRSLTKGIKSLFSRIKFDVENLGDLEDVLIQADFGVDAAEAIVQEVKNRA